MKRFSIILALLLVLLMALSLTACGEKPVAEVSAAEGSDSAPEAQAQAEPAAVLDPEEIEWGYQSYDPAETQYGDDAQYWYVDGVKSTTSFIFFEDGYLTTVEGESRTMVDTETVDKHVVDYDTKGEAFDFVFTDVFTCCDLVSGQWYMRADRDSVIASLTGAKYVCEVGSQWAYTFNADGTMVYDDDGTLRTGTWWFTDALTIHRHFDDKPADEGGGWFNINYEDGTWNVESIEDVDVYYPEPLN